MEGKRPVEGRSPPVIAHIVLFAPKPTLSREDRRQLGTALSQAIATIPSIRRARIGRRRTHGRPYEQLMLVNYTHAAILEFDDVQGLQVYLEHSAHEALAAQFFACFEQALFYDFELDDGALGVEALLEETD
jgi:hypothetical protein